MAQFGGEAQYGGLVILHLVLNSPLLIGKTCPEDIVHSDSATDTADNRIALAITICMHAALILFACWPAIQSSSNAGSNQSVGTSDLVVQFIMVERTVPPTNEIPMEETKPVEEVTKPEEKILEPILADAPMPVPVDEASSSSSSLSAASTLPAQVDAVGSESGSPGDGDDLEARYIAALKAAIYSQWKQSAPLSQASKCELVIKQTAGGSVLAAQLINCSATVADQRAFEAAALMAQPLPYAGFESVFVEARTVKVEL